MVDVKTENVRSKRKLVNGCDVHTEGIWITIKIFKGKTGMGFSDRMGISIEGREIGTAGFPKEFKIKAAPYYSVLMAIKQKLNMQVPKS